MHPRAEMEFDRQAGEVLNHLLLKILGAFLEVLCILGMVLAVGLIVVPWLLKKAVLG